MRKTLHYIYCNVDLYDHYLIVEIKSGIHISPEYNEVLKDISDTYYQEKPFVYLSHRKNSYSVDPAVYLEAAKIKNMVGFGVIAEVPVSGGNAQIEKLFLNKPFEIFTDLKDALFWAEHIVNNELQRS